MKTILNITGAVALTALASTAQANSLGFGGDAGATLASGTTGISLTLVGDFAGGFGGNSLLSYDPSLTLTSVDLTLGGEDGSFSCGTIGGVPSVNPACTSVPGTESVAWGSFFGFGPVAAGTVMATVTLTGAVDGGAYNFSLSDDLILGGWLSPLGAPFTPAYSGTTVTVDGGAPVIPVPAAVWLFGSGLLGLVGVARRKA